MKKLFPALAVAVCMSLAGPVLAEAYKMKLNMETAKTMMSNDGTISKESFMKHGGTEAQWNKMDLNKDSRLDANEIKSGFNEK